MPPKKKKGGKKKKKKNTGELTIDDKYKKTLDEIEALKDHLAIRKDFTRRAKAQEEEWRGKMHEAQHDLQETEETQRAVAADMTRQYKTMQTDMAIKVMILEGDLKKTTKLLEETQAELKGVKEDREKMEREKNEQIRLLLQKLAKMELLADRLLNDTLDNLMDRITADKPKWEDKSTYIQAQNKQTLLEFGLNPLDL